MGILDQLRAWRRSGVVVEYRNVTSSAVLNYSIERLYREQPALRAVVSFLADNVSSLPLKVYDRVSDTDRRRVTDCVAAQLLAHPNATTTAHDLTLGTVTDYLLYGWALWYRSRANTPSGWEVTRIPIAWVQNTLTEDGFSPSTYRVQNPESGRAPVDLPARDCVRFAQYDPKGQLHPHSPVESLKQVLSEQISAWEFRNGVWSNAGRVSQWISRPANVEWQPGARERFAKSWKERYSGNEGTNTGGTPLLEDGMRLESTQFNAREAQWQEATRLAREDVAAVYHVNPSMIWHTESQTYASAKDNARALYADTLSPILNMYENVVNSFLLPMIGEDPSRYCEFDLEAKLAGSFEERASVMQSAVGGPWMTRNEARAKLNMRALDGADELIVPLNVTEGGLAGANDTDPTTGYNAHPARTKAAPEVVRYKSNSAPPDDAVDGIADVLQSFSERQARSVFNAIRAGESKGRKAATDHAWWWDAARWDRELADDLEREFRRVCDLRGVSALADIGLDSALWDSARTANFIRAMAERRAELFNEESYERLVAELQEYDIGDPTQVTEAERKFLNSLTGRVARGAQTYATAVCGFATKEAVKQAYPEDTDTVTRTKTWRHNDSAQPRDSHAAMDGETVGIDERFSNGADYPGDASLGAPETVNCHCTMDVNVERKR